MTNVNNMLSPSQCSCCHGPFHPSSGMWVGSPTRFPFCGRCWRESLRCFQAMTNRKPSKRTRVKAEFYKPVPVVKSHETFAPFESFGFVEPEVSNPGFIAPSSAVPPIPRPLPEGLCEQCFGTRKATTPMGLCTVCKGLMENVGVGC